MQTFVYDAMPYVSLRFTSSVLRLHEHFDNKLTVDDLMLFLYMSFFTLLPVTARSTAWVSGRSFAKIRFRNPPGAWMSVCREGCL